MKQILLIGLLLLATMRVAGQAQNVDSLVNLLKTKNLKTAEQLEVYYKIYKTYVVNDLVKASEYAQKGLVLAEKANDKVMSSKFNAAFGRIYNTKASYDTSFVYWKKALDLAIETKDKDTEASTLLGIGILYDRQEKFIPSLEYYEKSLSIYENMGNKRSCVLVMSNIADMYRSMGNNEKAIEYLEKSKKIAEEINDPYGKLAIYFELGATHHELANVENKEENDKKALEYELKAYKISYDINDKSYQVGTTQALSIIYNGMNDEKSALKYAEECLQVSRELGDPNAIIAALSAMSTYYLAQKRYKECEATAIEAWKIDSTNMNIGSNLLINIIISNIASCNEGKAELFLEKYMNLVSRHIDQSNRETIADMEVKYETEKKEMRITALEKERRLYNWLGIAGGLLVVSMGVVLWLYSRNTKKERQLIANKALQDGELSERTRIAEDIHDRLGGSLSAVKIELKNAESLQNVSDKLDECIKEVREITHNLMPRSLRLFGMKGGLEDFAAQFPNVHFHFYGKEKRISDRMEFAVYCCASELITNSLRYSGAESINAQLVQDEKYVSLTVQDDGCGFDEKEIKPGIGLKNIRDRVASYNGKLDIASSPGNGTETTIELKVES